MRKYIHTLSLSLSLSLLFTHHERVHNIMNIHLYAWPKNRSWAHFKSTRNTFLERLTNFPCVFFVLACKQSFLRHASLPPLYFSLSLPYRNCPNSTEFIKCLSQTNDVNRKKPRTTKRFINFTSKRQNGTFKVSKVIKKICYAYLIELSLLCCAQILVILCLHILHVLSFWICMWWWSTVDYY